MGPPRRRRQAAASTALRDGRARRCRGDHRLLQQWHAAPIQIELLTEAIGKVAESGVTVAARVSPQHARDLAPDLLAAGVEILVVQGTIVSAEHVTADEEPLNLMHFIARWTSR